jgi:hypothetical protein
MTTQPQGNIQIQAPGFAGLNTQDPPLGMPLAFAARADNCVIDSLGRIASRNGFQWTTQDAEDIIGNIDTNPVVTAHEFRAPDGTTKLFIAGENDTATHTLWEQDSAGNLIEITGLTVSGSNWDYANLSNFCYMAQRTEDIYVTQGGTASVMAQKPQDFSGGLTGPNIILAAFGRLFIADSAADKTTVQWSVITTPTGLGATPWTGSDAGLINVEEYWPNGTDEIVGLAAHNNFLVVFGRRSILLYNVPTSADGTANVGPAYMTLADQIENIGCIARDTIVSTGTDLLFLDSTGVRSLNRTIQEKSVPVGDLSKNVRDELRQAIIATDLEIRAVYSPDQAMYCLLLPRITNQLGLVYVFDTRRPLEDGALRATKWNGYSFRCGLRDSSGRLLFGREGGLYEYTGGDDTSDLSTEDATSGIVMNYLTHPQNFDKPANLKFPKQVDITLFGGTSLSLTINWYFDFNNTPQSYIVDRAALVGALWNQGEWDIGQWGQPGGLFSVERINMWGSGKNVSLGFVGTLTETPVSIQELNLQALLGRLL